jgi:hypothetical protein
MTSPAGHVIVPVFPSHDMLCSSAETNEAPPPPTTASETANTLNAVVAEDEEEEELRIFISQKSCRKS